MHVTDTVRGMLEEVFGSSAEGHEMVEALLSDDTFDAAAAGTFPLWSP